MSSVPKRTELQCHLGTWDSSHTGTSCFLSLFVGCGRVPALVLVDLFRCVWRLERKEGVWRALRSRGGTSSFIWHCREVSNCGVATTVGVCVWRSDFMKASIWVHERCTWVYVFHTSWPVLLSPSCPCCLPGRLLSFPCWPPPVASPLVLFVRWPPLLFSLPLCLLVCCLVSVASGLVLWVLVWFSVFCWFVLAFLVFCLFVGGLVGWLAACSLRWLRTTRTADPNITSPYFLASRLIGWFVCLCFRPFGPLRSSWLLRRLVLLMFSFLLVGGADCSRPEPWTRLHSEWHWCSSAAPWGRRDNGVLSGYSGWPNGIAMLQVLCWDEDTLGVPEQSGSYYTAFAPLWHCMYWWEVYRYGKHVGEKFTMWCWPYLAMPAPPLFWRGTAGMSTPRHPFSF